MENSRAATACLEPSTTGLSVLVDPSEPDIDVVFVHGFTGHPVRTWSHKSVTVGSDRNNESVDAYHRPAKMPRLMSAISRPTQVNDWDREHVYWPKHLLPELLPSARIFTYGYDTNLRHAFGAPVSKNTVYDIAWDFLVSLDAARHSQSSKPIIFVAHSLGGIVVKEMLRRSASFQDHQIHLHQIYKSTSAIIFFGTPHGGADPRGFLQHFAEQVARACGLRVNEQVISTLLPSSERLRELRDEFGPMARREGWLIHSFQEQYGVQALGGKKVVEDVSSCLGDLSLETTQHIARNHMEICRFSGLDDQEYCKVIAAFDRIKSQIAQACQDQTRQQDERIPASDTERKALLDALSFPALNARYSTIRSAHSKTCKWLLHREEYQDWSDIRKTMIHHGIFWIKGKPGCGKSTILKFAVQNARRIKEAKVISFFFNARGEELERSTVGMYRSLLFQLIGAYPDLQTHISWPRSTDLHDGESYAWDIVELQTLFVDAFRKLGQRQLICFIDALDECEESQIRDLIRFLEELGEIVISSQINFRACLSSRHYPYISIQNGIELTLEGQEGHDQDIARYLDGELRAGKGKQCEVIKEEIRNRASGVFLWVALVVQILNKEYDHGRVHTLRRRLKEIPDGLDKLFEDILTRDQERVDQLILCLQWILYAMRPLKREELYYGILSGTDADELDWASPDTVSVEDMERFILSCSKGLAETTKAKAQNVQFIHESVRDFLVGKNGFNKLKSELETGRSHERLKRCCLEHISIDTWKYLPAVTDLPVWSSEDAKELRAQVSERFPFLQYATQYVLSHAERAEQDGVSQQVAWNNFEVLDWIKLHNLFEKFQVRRFDDKTTLLLILTKKNHSHLVHIELERELLFMWQSPQYTLAESLKFGRWSIPLHVALTDTKISDDTLREFLSPIFKRSNGNGALDIQQKDREDYQQVAIEAMIKIRPIHLRKGQDFLAWVVSYGPDAVLYCLLANGDISPTCVEDYSRPLLCSVARRGFQTVVKLLVSKLDVTVDVEGPHGQTPLSYAAENGHEAVVQILLSEDADPDARDVLGRSPLLYAAKFGRKSVVNALLSKVTDPDAQDHEGLTPLCYAVQNGSADVVSSILMKTNAANHKSKKGQTPLSIAVGRGNLAVVDALLARPDVDVNSKDDLGESPLWRAAWTTMSDTKDEISLTKRLLTVENIDVFAADNRGYSPLFIATAGRRWAVAALISLRSKGVSVLDISDVDDQILLDEAILINQQCLRNTWGHHGHFDYPSHSKDYCINDQQWLNRQERSDGDWYNGYTNLVIEHHLRALQ